jgi:polyhydroxyalkanoate synthase
LALRPTAALSKWIGFFDRAFDPEKLAAFRALEGWASENIAFPAAAYRRYIAELYQQNALVRGEHWVRGRRVDLGAIACPLLTVVTDRDAICPPPAASALEALVGSPTRERLVISGGHVGAVVGKSASRELYPRLAGFLKRELGSVQCN